MADGIERDRCRDFAITGGPTVVILERGVVAFDVDGAEACRCFGWTDRPFIGAMPVEVLSSFP
jgi:hypothetical protein